MITFDAAERSMCTVKRQATSTPLQSLVLLNDPQYIETSRALAESVIMSIEEKPSECIAQSFKRVISRAPSSTEVDMLMEIYDSELSRFTSDEISKMSVIQIGESKSNNTINKEKLAALTIVVNAIMNLDEAKHA